MGSRMTKLTYNHYKTLDHMATKWQERSVDFITIGNKLENHVIDGLIEWRDAFQILRHAAYGPISDQDLTDALADLQDIKRKVDKNNRH